MIRDTIKAICKSLALAHRHAADHLAALCDMVSILMMLKVMNAMMRPVMAVRVSEIDNMMQEAQVKVDVIKKAKEAVQGARPINKVIFAQNCPMYNAEWKHLREGRATSYLACLVTRYMDELMQKDKQLVLSSKALEVIYHMASSSAGKLILGKHYLGGYTLGQVHDKKEMEGAKILTKKKHKIMPKDSSQPSTSSQH